MRLAFSKMQGLGNDFVVLDATERAIPIDPALARRLADRRFGIGCDQILLVEPPRLPGTEFHYRIFNADGSEVEQCGNGARCFARFVRDRGITEHDEIPVGTAAGPIRLYLEDAGQVRVDMGAPEFRPERIPFLADREAQTYTLDVAGESLVIGALSMGNPHAIMPVEDLDTAPVARLGPLVESHPRFPQRVNVGFMQILARDHLRLRVYERGAGETLACGTGACAAMAHARRCGLVDARVRVSLPGGDLLIGWNAPGESVWMTGPAVQVFQGEIEL
jgi:diaminopimelate epimerase